MDQSGHFHAVRLIQEKCKGCVNCIKRCPTEAIRVREGKAEIAQLQCVDCGECIRVCPNHAKTAVADTLERIASYRVRIALPAPALYAQFDESVTVQQILDGLLELGFDDVFEVALAADLVSARTRREIANSGIVRPIISAACPAIVRLIQVRYPNLVDNISVAASPLRVASLLARDAASVKFGVKPNEIGVFFLTPCPAKVAAIREPVGYVTHSVDGAIPIAEIFGPLSKAIRSIKEQPGKIRPKASGLGIGWARSGGENMAVGVGRQINVDGVHNVIEVFEDVEKGKLSDIDYIEALACVGGCVGGVLAVENSFVARRRIRLLSEKVGKSRKRPTPDEIIDTLDPTYLVHDTRIEPRSMMALAEDMREAIRRMERLEHILEELPGLDCGSCGAPTCQSLAEDIVRGEAVETDCIFVLRQRVNRLAQELGGLTSKLPPSMQKSSNKKDILEQLLELESEDINNDNPMLK